MILFRLAYNGPLSVEGLAEIYFISRARGDIEPDGTELPTVTINFGLVGSSYRRTVSP